MPHNCYQCGNTLDLRSLEGHEREICLSCGWINYEHLKISAGGRVEQNGMLLLVQRGTDPFKGTWHMPAGYIEVDELPVHASERETYEESGLVVKVNHLVDAYYYDDDPRGNGVVLIFEAEVKGGRLCASDETLQAKFFKPDELSGIPLAGVSAKQSIQAWLAEKKKYG